MYSFPVSLLPFLAVINLFGDVIITVINGFICPNANVTVHIQSTGIPYWRIPHFGSSCQTCYQSDGGYPILRYTRQFTFYSNTGQEITNIEKIQFVHPRFPEIFFCRSPDIDVHHVLDHIKLGFQMTSVHSVTDQLVGINVPWVWNRFSSIHPQIISIQKSKLHLNIEQNAKYPYNVESLDRVNCTTNLTYNITVEHDCPPRKETTITETTGSKTHQITTKIPKTKANKRKNGEPTKKKIDPRLINSLAVSGSAVIIATVASLVMYFGWYKRKLNQLGLLPQNATPAQN